MLKWQVVFIGNCRVSLNRAVNIGHRRRCFSRFQFMSIVVRPGFQAEFNGDSNPDNVKIFVPFIRSINEEMQEAMAIDGTNQYPRSFPMISVDGIDNKDVLIDFLLFFC